MKKMKKMQKYKTSPFLTFLVAAVSIFVNLNPNFEIVNFPLFYLEIGPGFSRDFWVCTPYFPRFFGDRTSPTKICEIGQLLFSISEK